MYECLYHRNTQSRLEQEIEISKSLKEYRNFSTRDKELAEVNEEMKNSPDKQSLLNMNWRR